MSWGSNHKYLSGMKTLPLQKRSQNRYGFLTLNYLIFYETQYSQNIILVVIARLTWTLHKQKDSELAKGLIRKVSTLFEHKASYEKRPISAERTDWLIDYSQFRYRWSLSKTTVIWRDLKEYHKPEESMHIPTLNYLRVVDWEHVPAKNGEKWRL